MNIGFIAFAVYGAIVTSAMVWATCQAPPENSTAIVLGAQVKPWGPSVILRGRIDAANHILTILRTQMPFSAEDREVTRL